MVVTMLLLFLAIGINIMDYTAPVPEQPQVVYQKAYGLFGPIFYGAEHAVQASKPLLHFLDFVAIVVESIVAFFLLLLTYYTSRSSRVSLVFTAILMALLSLHFITAGSYISVIPVYLLVLSILTFTQSKSEVIHSEKDTNESH